MSTKSIDQLIRSEILQMQAYHVQPSNGLVKMDLMENPYSLTEELISQWLTKIRPVQINRYPDPFAQNIKQTLTTQYDLSDKHDIMFGNGSDELIQIIIQALSVKSGPVMSISPTFVMYQVLSTITGKQYIDVPLNDDFTLDCDALIDEILSHQPACVFLAYPNNPTGNLFAKKDIKRVLETTSGIVVVDEAYLPFAGETLISWLTDYPNLFILRTLSKAGLAGLRFGMLIAARNWINELQKIRLPLNINCLTQASVEFALENVEFFEQNAEKIVEERGRMSFMLKQLPGIEVFDSSANFILFRSTKMPATSVFEGLLERHILIKCLHKPDAMLAQCLRVTIGTQAENNLFLDSMKEIVRDKT